MTAQGRAELEAWLARDRRHRGALLRAQAVLHLAEDAVVRGSPALSRSGNDSEYGPRAPRRFGRMTVAASLACVLLAGTMFAMSGRSPPAERVSLADGSVVTLQEDAQIRAEVTGRMRSITLVSGEARFEVAKDPSRPFVVRAGEVSAQATGTVYAVGRVGESGAQVRVDEGSVLVWAREGREQAVLLRAGGRLTLEPGASGDGPPPATEAAEIALNNDTIDAAVARFNRINRTRIVVGDPRIGSVRIVGLFRANDPDAFAQAAAAVAGGRVVRRGDEIVIEDRRGAVKKN